jgi:glycosyltransferase involved in cell wall biosynthesis
MEKQRMRVLVIDKTAVLATNHERYSELAKIDGVELSVLSPRVWIEHGRRVPLEVTASPDYQLYLGRTGFKGYYGRGFYITGLGRALRRCKPDIIQLLEEPWSFFAAQTMRKASRWARRAKIVFYSWENIYRDFEYPSRISRLYSRIDHKMHRRAAGAVCATEQAEHVLRLKGFKPPSTVIPYGAPRIFFNVGDNPTTASNTRPFTIGYIGRYLKMKGLDDLLTSLAYLPAVHLRLYGEGKDREEFENRARQLKLEDRVLFNSALPPEEVPQALGDLDALVLPSRTTPEWSEQFGRVIIEAMAAGVPVLGAQSGAIPEVIGDAGLLFKEGSTRQLIERLTALRDDSDLRQQLVERGRKRAVERFTWRRFAHDMAEFWSSL